METRPNDPARWRDAVLPEAEDRLVGAIDQLADFPVLDGTVMRGIAIAADPQTTTPELGGAPPIWSTSSRAPRPSPPTGCATPTRPRWPGRSAPRPSARP